MICGPVHPMVLRMARIESSSGLGQWRDQPPRVGHGIVYAGVSPITGKIYIGLHSRGTVPRAVSSSRWVLHRSGLGKCPAIQAACQKYDIQWFVIEELKVEFLERAEQEWIRLYETLAPNGYNLTEGGRAGGRSLVSIEKGISTRETNQSIIQQVRRSTMSGTETLSFDRKRSSVIRSVKSARKRRHGEDVPLVSKSEQMVAFRKTIEAKRQHRIDTAKDESEAAMLKKRFERRDRNSQIAKDWAADPSLRTTSSERAVARESLKWAGLHEKRDNGVVEYRKCTTCSETKASTEFGVQKRKSGSLGFNPTCKYCKAEKDRERRRISKQGLVA